MSLLESQRQADLAALAVVVTYTNVQPAVTDIRVAVANGDFFPGVGEERVAGDPDGAIAGAAHRINGEIVLGTQFHMSMETQVTKSIHVCRWLSYMLHIS